MVQEKLRAVFYARVSTEEERQLNALEKQVAECKDAVLQKGWKLVDQYVDEGKSGKMPLLTTAWEEITKTRKSAMTILTWMISRFFAIMNP